jgi:hypothetical protein
LAIEQESTGRRLTIGLVSLAPGGRPSGPSLAPASSRDPDFHKETGRSGVLGVCDPHETERQRQCLVGLRSARNQKSLACISPSRSPDLFVKNLDRARRPGSATKASAIRAAIWQPTAMNRQRKILGSRAARHERRSSARLLEQSKTSRLPAFLFARCSLRRPSSRPRQRAVSLALQAAEMRGFRLRAWLTSTKAWARTRSFGVGCSRQSAIMR